MEEFEREMAARIDHTILNPDATDLDIKRVCEEAVKYGFYSVCVNPVNVAVVKNLLVGSDVKTCTVVGFPLGASGTSVKVFETEEAIAAGADEIDMVIDIGAFKSGNSEKVYTDIAGVVKAAGKNALVKVIVETCLLTEAEKIGVCRVVKDAGAGYIKTSTGFSRKGAELEDIRLMREILGGSVLIKASGGIGDYSTACAMLAAGSDRIGTSKSVAIVSKGK